jgi:hypothetical protein
MSLAHHLAEPLVLKLRFKGEVVFYQGVASTKIAATQTTCRSKFLFL